MNRKRKSRAKYRKIHFKRDVRERVRDERTTERIPKRMDDWIGREDELDIIGVDDALPSNVFIRKSSDEYSIGIVENVRGKRRFRTTHYLQYLPSTIYKDHLYIDYMGAEESSLTQKGIGAYLIREFLKDTDKRDLGLHLYSMENPMYGMTGEQRMRMWKSFGFQSETGKKRGNMVRNFSNSKLVGLTEKEQLNQYEKNKQYWRNYEGDKLIIGTGKPTEVPTDE